MNEHLESEIHNYCYSVKTGCKPMAIVSVQNRYFHDAVILIQSYNLEIHHENLTEDWTNIWIYKHEYLKNVIKYLPDKPKSTYDHWILGKAFGYSDEAIGEFIKKGEKS